MSESTIVIKCVAIGDGYVGKTCLLSRVANTPYQESYIATIFENSSTQIQYEGQLYNVHLFDTAGQEEYEQIRGQNYSSATIILVCFSIENTSSFQNVAQLWLPEVLKYGSEAALILVGTKSDLRGDAETMDRMNISQDNYVNAKAAVQLAKRFNARYIECSAKSDDNIGRLKTAIIEVSLFRRRPGEDSGLLYCLSSTWNYITKVLCCKT